jgi:hypothetical protein
MASSKETHNHRKPVTIFISWMGNIAHLNDEVLDVKGGLVSNDAKTGRDDTQM